MSARRLDFIDGKILNKLSMEGRLSFRQLAEQIHLSQTPTLRRVRRLENDNYITGYAATLNDEKVLGPISLISMVRVDPEFQQEFENRIVEIPQIVSCSMLSLRIDYTFMMYAKEMPHAYELIDMISGFEGIWEITSHPVSKVISSPPQIPKWRQLSR